MKRGHVFLIILLLVQTGIVPLVAEETWQGNAAVALRGEVDRSGLVAASNAFPRGTRIEVTNLDNGRTVTVTVVGRLNGGTNVFLLLSEKAAAQIGLEPKDVARISSRVVGISNDLTGGVNEFTYRSEEETDVLRRTPEVDQTTITQATPTPGPTPQPTPGPTPVPTPTEMTRRGFEKDHFTRPYGVENADVTTRNTPPSERIERGEVELKEARVPLKERAEAVIITRPTAPTETDVTASGEENLPEVAARERGQANEYTTPTPAPDEVVAILIEPKETITREDGTVTTVDRPTLDEETIELALNHPELTATERPFIYERHGLGRQREEITLTALNLPEVTEAEKASVDAYVKRAQEEDRAALETHVLPEVTEGEKPDVNALARTERDQERVEIERTNLPDIQEREKPDVSQKPDVEGRDERETDIALVPTNPRPPERRETVESTHETTTHNGTTTVVRESGTEYLRNFYYLQIGVYKNRKAAENILQGNPTYPMMIVTDTINTTTVYKVVVGPLRRDESGTVLYLFRARGFRDAFIRYIN
ncbi:MAG TPA: SPOR domain-containing protein [Spirochaetia bacterium]|nr:SPOR domain-containing protein [Spirochaetia bacterium]